MFLYENNETNYNNYVPNSHTQNFKPLLTYVIIVFFLELGFSTFNIRQPSHKSITSVEQTYEFNITHYK